MKGQNMIRKGLDMFWKDQNVIMNCCLDMFKKFLDIFGKGLDILRKCQVIFRKCLDIFRKGLDIQID